MTADLNRRRCEKGTIRLTNSGITRFTDGNFHLITNRNTVDGYVAIKPVAMLIVHFHVVLDHDRGTRHACKHRSMLRDLGLCVLPQINGRIRTSKLNKCPGRCARPRSFNNGRLVCGTIFNDESVSDIDGGRLADRPVLR